MPFVLPSLIVMAPSHCGQVIAFIFNPEFSGVMEFFLSWVSAVRGLCCYAIYVKISTLAFLGSHSGSHSRQKNPRLFNRPVFSIQTFNEAVMLRIVRNQSIIVINTIPGNKYISVTESIAISL